MQTSYLSPKQGSAHPEALVLSLAHTDQRGILHSNQLLSFTQSFWENRLVAFVVHMHSTTEVAQRSTPLLLHHTAEKQTACWLKIKTSCNAKRIFSDKTRENNPTSNLPPSPHKTDRTNPQERERQQICFLNQFPVVRT